MTEVVYFKPLSLMVAVTCEHAVCREYRRVGYEAANAPAFQLGGAVYSFSLCVAEVDQGFLAQTRFGTTPGGWDVRFGHRWKY